MDRFSVALDKFTNSIDEKLKNASEISKIMNEQLLSTLEELSETLNQQTKTSAEERNADYKKFSDTMESLINNLTDVSEKVKTQQENSANDFENLARNLLEDLKNFAQQQKDYLGKTADTNAMQISEAVKSFRTIVDNHNSATQRTFAQIQNLLNQNENFLQNMGAATTFLKQAAEPVQQSTLQLTKNLEETSAQMKNLSAANQTTRQNLLDLTASLSTFVNNFNGIADELEHSAKIICDSLDNYNTRTNAGLKEKLEAFDNSMNQAFSYLSELVEELSGVVEDSRHVRGR